MSLPPRTSAAERQRRFRIRAARGLLQYTVEVPGHVIERMIDAGRISEADAGDRAVVALELAAMIGERASLMKKP